MLRMEEKKEEERREILSCMSNGLNVEDKEGKVFLRIRGEHKFIPRGFMPIRELNDKRKFSTVS